MSPFCGDEQKVIGKAKNRLVHEQPFFLKEMSERFVGRKTEGCEARFVGSICSGWCDAERHGMHSHAERWNDRVKVFRQ